MAHKVDESQFLNHSNFSLALIYNNRYLAQIGIKLNIHLLIMTAGGTGYCKLVGGRKKVAVECN